MLAPTPPQNSASSQIGDDSNAARNHSPPHRRRNRHRQPDPRREQHIARHTRRTFGHKSKHERGNSPLRNRSCTPKPTHASRNDRPSSISPSLRARNYRRSIRFFTTMHGNLHSAANLAHFIAGPVIPGRSSHGCTNTASPYRSWCRSQSMPCPASSSRPFGVMSMYRYAVRKSSSPRENVAYV